MKRYQKAAAVAAFGAAGTFGLSACGSNAEGGGTASFSYGQETQSPGTISISPNPNTTIPETQPPTSASPTHTTETTAASPSTHPEIAQFSTDLFTNTNLATTIGKTVVGNSYNVICRIPYGGNMGSTMVGGEYVIDDPSAPLGYAVAAANDFENGTMPNQNPFDPALKNDICPTGEY